MAHWGMPSPKSLLEEGAMKRAVNLAARGKPVDIELLKRTEPDPGVTNIRNTKSPHWLRWLELVDRQRLQWEEASNVRSDGLAL